MDIFKAEKVLIAVVGPTGIGKTQLAIKIAQHFKTAIISADSRQFYKEMHIGTAVPSLEELNAVPHHFVQHIPIFQNYTVGDFERDAIALLHKLFKKNDVVVMVGGSGLYIDVVINGLDDFPVVAPEIREQLKELFQKEGIAALQEQLKMLDPVYYEQVDVANPHRLMRALEICIGTGKPFSSFLNRKREARFFKSCVVGLEAERKIIYNRINERVDHMMEHGLLQEAKELLEHRHINALQTVGYKELFNYFDGQWSLDFAVSEIKKNTRRFAKRQMTWFKKREEVLWVDYQEDVASVIEKIKNSVVQ